jgi:hypothetical protein
MEGRPDRLSLFWDLDLRLGGVITEELERMSTKPGYYGWAISKALLAAKAEGELKSKVRHICHEAVRYTAGFLGEVEPGFKVNAAVLAAALSERFGYKFAVENNPNASGDTEIDPDWLNCWLKGQQLEDGFVLGIPRIGTLI